MRFMVTWTFKPEHAQDTIKRFKETGAPSPDGVKLLSRWHDVAGRRGFALTETDDPIAAARMCRQWSDLLSFDVIPVLDDNELGQALEH